jgi:glycosyltransferase involved in cell wall biosynthesis
MIIPSYKPAYHYGGPIRSVAALCESLVIAGQDVTVFTTNANGAENLSVDTNQYYSVEGVNVRYFNRWTKGHFNVSPTLFLEVIRKAKKFDIIHIHSWWNPIAVLITLLCLLLNRKPVLSPRGSVSTYSFANGKAKTKLLFHKLFGQFLLKRTMLHVTSNEEKKETEKYVGKEVHQYIIPNILELPQRIYSSPIENGVFKLVFLGRIDPAKNLELLLRVLSGFDSIPIKLILVGKGDEAYEKELSSTNTGRHELIWMGPVYGDERFKILAGSDLFVLPSFTENYGNAVLEALSQGTPVLISDNVGAKDFVLEHDLGWVIKGNEAALRNAIEIIWKDSDKRKDIRSRAPGLVSLHFAPLEIANDYVTMYNQHSKGNKPA